MAAIKRLQVIEKKQKPTLAPKKPAPKWKRARPPRKASADILSSYFLWEVVGRGKALVALIEQEGRRKPITIRKGQRLKTGVTVKAITPDYVTLAHGTHLKKLRLED